MSANPLRTLQDAHAPECMCRPCLDADNAKLLPDPISCDDEDDFEDDDYERDPWELECDAADAKNDTESCYGERS